MDRSKPLKRCLTVGATSYTSASAGDRVSSRHTLGVEQLLLRRLLLVHGAELEAERLGVVLGARQPHHRRRLLAVDGLCADNRVLVELVLEQRADTRDDTDAHGGGRGMCGRRIETETKRPSLQTKECWPTYRDVELCNVEVLARWTVFAGPVPLANPVTPATRPRLDGTGTTNARASSPPPFTAGTAMWKSITGLIWHGMCTGKPESR
jgi:hypothetical protein